MQSPAWRALGQWLHGESNLAQEVATGVTREPEKRIEVHEAREKTSSPHLRACWRRQDASGGVKIVEIGRFENRCIRGRIPGKRRCASPWLQKKNDGRRYFDGSRGKKMAVLLRFSNRLIYTILKSPLAQDGCARQLAHGKVPFITMSAPRRFDNPSEGRTTRSLKPTIEASPNDRI